MGKQEDEQFFEKQLISDPSEYETFASLYSSLPAAWQSESWTGATFSNSALQFHFNKGDGTFVSSITFPFS